MAPKRRNDRRASWISERGSKESSENKERASSTESFLAARALGTGSRRERVLSNVAVQSAAHDTQPSPLSVSPSPLPLALALSLARGSPTGARFVWCPRVQTATATVVEECQETRSSSALFNEAEKEMQAYMLVPWREPTALQHLERLAVYNRVQCLYIGCPSSNAAAIACSFSSPFDPSLCRSSHSTLPSLSLSLAFTRGHSVLYALLLSGQVDASGSQLDVLCGAHLVSGFSFWQLRVSPFSVSRLQPSWQGVVSTRGRHGPTAFGHRARHARSTSGSVAKAFIDPYTRGRLCVPTFTSERVVGRFLD